MADVCIWAQSAHWSLCVDMCSHCIKKFLSLGIIQLLLLPYLGDKNLLPLFPAVPVASLVMSLLKLTHSNVWRLGSLFRGGGYLLVVTRDRMVSTHWGSAHHLILCNREEQLCSDISVVF